MWNIYETSPEGIVINSKLLAINIKPLKRFLIASCFNGEKVLIKKIWTAKIMSFSGKYIANMFNLKISECLW